MLVNSKKSHLENRGDRELYLPFFASPANPTSSTGNRIALNCATVRFVVRVDSATVQFYLGSVFLEARRGLYT